MKTKKSKSGRLLICVVLLAAGAASAQVLQSQFQWSERIASANSWPDGIPDVGLVLDTNDNVYVTGWFDGTNDFGGVTLTNQSTDEGSDIFVAKYNLTGALQWARQAGGTVGYSNNGRGIGVDNNGNVYVTGGYYGAIFGGLALPAPSSGNEGFFLAKYDNAGTIQWVKNAVGVYGNLNGLGMTVDSAGNSYVLADDDADDGATVSFGSVNVAIPADYGESTILVKYDSSGTAQWAVLLGGSGEVYATKVAVDTNGNIYVRGTFFSTLTIGSTTLTVSAGSSENAFIAKFNSSGSLVWVQQPTVGNVDEGGVAVDPAGNVYISGGFDNTLNFGNGIILTNEAPDTLFGDAFVAKYNSAGTIQWAQSAGGTNGGFYWDIALDGQTNVYPAGFLGIDANVAKYNSSGTLQWSESAAGPPASPVSSLVGKCAVDPAGNCYLAGWYAGTATFGTTTLQPQGTWNFFLAELPSNTVANPTIQFTASPTSGAPPLTVQFNSPSVDSFGSNVVSWYWNFGDGATTNTQNPSHTYMNAGVFSPSLIATNNLNETVIGYGPQIMTSGGASATNLTYITNSGAITITGFTGSPSTIVIPDAINDYPVISIGDDAFLECSNLTSVTIPNSVTSIGDGAFAACSSLMSVTIPNSVTSIGEEAFDACSSLTSVIIGDSVASIGDDAFAYCSSLTSVTIPNSVTSIGDFVFFYCSSLTDVTIGNSVTSIGEEAFYACSSLTSVTIPNSVASIEEGAFNECSSLTNVTIPNSVTSIGEDAFEYCSSLTSVTIPNSVASIGDYVFGECSSLTSVTIPNNVTSIGEGAFGDCNGLTNVTIPASVTSIGEDAFANCSSLHQAYFQGNAPDVNGGAGSADNTVFFGESGTAYYLPGATGWGSTFGSWPTALWHQPSPVILGGGSGFGLQNNQFGFTISWATNLSVVVQASTNLLNWTPIITNALVNGTNYFTDPQWTNYPQRFYRISAP